MVLTLETLAEAVRRRMADRAICDAAPEICETMRDYLTDPDFIARHLPDRAAGANPREVLFEDPDLGFCICGHVYSGAAESGPHDHGSSWAIYGQAEGETEMTDWKIVRPGTAGEPALVEPARVYTLQPGDAYFYDVGAVHSPRRFALTRLIRIEGANLDHVQRSAIEAA